MGYKDGKMQKADFIKIFHMAFPSRPEEKLTRLADEIANKNGEISMANTMILLYLFCEGKENNVDLATTRAEVFKKADGNQDEVMDFNEFKDGMMRHPLTSKILREKTLDALLEPM